MWGTSCPDWRDRLLSGRSLVPELLLFREEAERAVRIFKRLRIPDMHGKPAMGDVAGPWLYPIVEAIFGSYDPDTHSRMIQEFFWLIPKKNTKTSSAAAIAIVAMILNRRPEAEFVLVAPTKEIADISFKQASGTIRADHALDALFQTQGHIRKITHRTMGASLQVRAADTDVITGGKQVGTIVDELHVLADKAEAADMLVEIRGALAARPDGFLIIITTQSKKPPAGVFRAELNKARAVRDGKLRLPLLPILYELPPELSKDNGWRDRRYWPLLNPNLGRSVSLEFLERELESAEREGVAQLALFASQHFNVEIGIGSQHGQLGRRRVLGGIAGSTHCIAGRPEGALRGHRRRNRRRRPRRPARSHRARPGTRNGALALLVACLGAQDRAGAPQGDRPASARFREGRIPDDRRYAWRRRRRRRRHRLRNRSRGAAGGEAGHRRRIRSASSTSSTNSPARRAGSRSSASSGSVRAGS